MRRPCRGRWLWRIIERTGVLPAGLFLLAACWFTPIADQVEFDPDEGVNLIKALLHAHGYVLYEQVWSDQPPLVTLLLAQVYEWAGPSLVAARAMTLGFAALLVWAMYQTLRLRVSVTAAMAGVLLLAISRMYLRLSVSVMIGLPALALAMLAIHLLLRSRRAHTGGAAVVLLVASGAVMALAMQAKLFAAVVLLPAVMVLVLPDVRGKRGEGRGVTSDAHGVTPWASRWWISGWRWGVVIWGATVAGVFVISMALLGGAAGEQLVGTHLAAQGRTWSDALHDLVRLAGMVTRHAIYLPLAAAAVVWAWRRDVTDAALPTAWFVLAAVLLSVHRPLWYHHVLLLTIPLAWLAGYGVQAWLDWHTTPRLRLATAAAIVGGLMLPLATPLWRQLHDETFGYRFALHREVLDELARTSWQGNPSPAWIFTDRPTYAYLADRLVPPALAVQTSKRWQAGQLTPERVLQAMRTYRPRDVVLERYNNDRYGPQMQTYLERHYELRREVREAGSYFPSLRHHVRKVSGEP